MQTVITRLNGNLITHFPLQNNWLQLESEPGNFVVIRIAEIELEVRYEWFAFTIRIASHYYSDNLEGICGKYYLQKLFKCT